MSSALQIVPDERPRSAVLLRPIADPAEIIAVQNETREFFASQARRQAA